MLIYGHRGARGEAPENTLAGFHRALSAGVTRVELDLRLSRDEQLVVIHDDTVNRTTNGRGAVAQLSAQALARLDARRGAPACPTPQPVPTIARVLEEFPQIVHFQLEAKPVSATQRVFMAERLALLFAEFQLHQRATVTSFDADLLRELGASAARIPRGLISDRTRPDPLKLALELKVELLVLNWKLCTAARIASAHASGIRVSAWTVNDEKVAQRLHAHGIDSIVTDYPTRMMALSLSLQDARPEA
ncbi:MAG: glycerophosphodiester phosphodiesterase [Pseudomonadales bacterium]|nr:glycerophosphodiester phosphodiesterase [Pseudomonadales bacterium]